jgi:branched-chain amino acid aminotransferase
MGVRIWVNGRLRAPEEASLSALDHGVTVGDGAFETAKIVDGVPFALSRHERRLDRSLAGLGLPPADHDALRDGIHAVLAAGEGIRFGRLRYTVTAGIGPAGSDRVAPEETQLNYIVTASDQAQPPESCAVVMVPWTRNERAATAGLKTTSYADNVIALAYARQRGASEAVFANTRGELCEGTGSNVFVVVDGVLISPPAQSGLLEGITRELTMAWCREDGMPVEERAVPLEVLRTADEVFITSSTRDVLAVSLVDDRVLTPGPVTARAAKIFAERSADNFDP